MSRSLPGTFPPPKELLALRERLAEVFEAGGGAETEGNATEAALSWMPAVDVVANDRAIILTLEVTGVGPDDLGVELLGGTLIVRGQRQRAPGCDAYHRLERAMGPFERTIALPGPVDPERVQAELDDGVLTIRMLRAPSGRGHCEQRRRIGVQAVALAPPKS